MRTFGKVVGAVGLGYLIGGYVFIAWLTYQLARFEDID